MNEICVWKSGEWCFQYDLAHRIEEYGVPDLEFTFPFHLPNPVMEALMDTLMPSLTSKI